MAAQMSRIQIGTVDYLDALMGRLGPVEAYDAWWGGDPVAGDGDMQWQLDAPRSGLLDELPDLDEPRRDDDGDDEDDDTED